MPSPTPPGANGGRRARPLVAVTMAANLLVTLATWWVLETTSARTAGPGNLGPSAVRRVAELQADAARPAFTRADRLALADLVQRWAGWPAIVYVSIEDDSGLILAHTDPGRVGAVWSNSLAAEIARTVRVPYAEVTVPIPRDPLAPWPLLAGHLRLGYALDASETDGVGPGEALLASALAGSLATGVVLAWTRRRPAKPPPAPAGATVEQLTVETVRLRRELNARASELVTVRRELEHHRPAPVEALARPTDERADPAGARGHDQAAAGRRPSFTPPRSSS